MELKNVYLVKKNGVVKVFDTFDDSKKEGTKCFGCAKGYPGMCPRMDIDNQMRIDKYDFIVSGIQSYDEKGKMKRFIVSECFGYKEKDNSGEKLSIKEKSELANSLMIEYFGAEDIDDAIRTQERLAKEGKLKTNTTIAEQKKLVKKLKK